MSRCETLFYFCFFFKKNLIYLFIYFWLCWVLVSVWGLSPVVASVGHSSSRCAGLSPSRPLVGSTGSRRAGSVIVAHGKHFFRIHKIRYFLSYSFYEIYFKAGSKMSVLLFKLCKSLLPFRAAWFSWLEKWMGYWWLVVEDIMLMTLLLLDWLLNQ